MVPGRSWPPTVLASGQAVPGTTSSFDRIVFCPCSKLLPHTFFNRPMPIRLPLAVDDAGPLHQNRVAAPRTLHDRNGAVRVFLDVVFLEPADQAGWRHAVPGAVRVLPIVTRSPLGWVTSLDRHPTSLESGCGFHAYNPATSRMAKIIGAPMPTLRSSPNLTSGWPSRPSRMAIRRNIVRV